jgi:hypothetical protein
MTADGPTLGLVVPLFDESARFGEFAKDLVAYIRAQPTGSELVFVDDGSRDGTAVLVAEFVGGLASGPDAAPVRLLARPHTGKGGAVAAGLRSLHTDLAGFCDIDLSTPLDQFDRVVRAASRAPVLAIGSRDVAGSQLVRPEGPVREVLGRLYNRALQATVTPGIVDTQCGAKVAAKSVWDEILPHTAETGFAWDAEIVALAQALAITVQEVPIEWHHDDRSTVRVGRDGAAMVVATARIWKRARAVRHARTAAPAALGAAAPHSTEVFDAENAAELSAADRTHWWFRSKAALVATAIRRTAHAAPQGWLVDSGGGAGGVTSMLGWDPNRALVAEGNATLAQYAHDTRGLSAVRAGVARLPVAPGAADVVCLLDVIEHLADPVPALEEAGRVLAPGGRLVVNVPAHAWLWSQADVHLGHHRRYTRKSLTRDLAAAGFRPVVLTHVFSWLVPFVWVQRRLARDGSAATGLETGGALVDRTAMVLTTIERGLLGRASLPFGTSVLCVAVRVGERDA